MSTVGSSAPGQHTINYDALLSTTLFNYKAKMYDNIFKSNAFLAALRKYGGVDFQDGGERIQRLLMYEENDTFKSYRGYDTLTVKPQDGITSAFYEWGEIGGTISISRREERQNSGEAKILSLLEQKIKQAEMSAKAKVNQMLIQGTVSGATFVPGNDAQDLYPLGYFLPKTRTTDPTAGGNVGNLSRSSYTWWRPMSATFGGTAEAYDDFGISVSTWKGLKVALARMWNYCSRGADGSGPNLIVSDQMTYENYENALDQDKRYAGDADMAAMGFDSVKLKGATMIWDELVPDIESGTTSLTYGTAFFLNTQFYSLIIDRETDFVTTPFVEPENQTAKTAKVLFMGNSSANNMRKLGVARKITLSITS